MCLIAIRLPFGFDESLTIGTFVTAPSVFDAATTQVRANNHQAISVLDHLVRAVFHTTSEPAMRTLPTLFFVTATVVLATATSHRFGWKAGLLTGALFCTNPAVFAYSCQVRGYGLLILCTIVSTLMLDAMRRLGRVPLGLALSYLVVATIGMSAQSYMLLPLAMQGAAALTHPILRKANVFVYPALAGLLGLALQVQLLRPILDAEGGARLFRATFPWDLALSLMGGSIVAATATAILSARPLWKARRMRPLLAASTVGLAVIATFWLVGPPDLYPRFFLTLVPWIALATAVGATSLLRSRAPVRGAALVLLGIIFIAHAVTIWPTLWRPSLANRDAAALAEMAIARGETACVLRTSYQPMIGYLALRPVGNEAEFQSCDLVVSLVPEFDAPALEALDRDFPYEVVLDDAASLGRIFSRVPI